jgi:hypothetical protein
MLLTNFNGGLRVLVRTSTASMLAATTHPAATPDTMTWFEHETLRSRLGGHV